MLGEYAPERLVASQPAELCGPRDGVSLENQCLSHVYTYLFKPAYRRRAYLGLKKPIEMSGTNTGVSGHRRQRMRIRWPGSYNMPIPMFPELEKPIKVGIPVFKWADAVDHGEEFTADKDGVEGADRLRNPIKFMMNYASQCIMNQHADPARVREILEDESKLETLVVIDTHMTPTAKMADYLLPDVMSVEQPDLVLNHEAADTGFAVYAQPAIESPGNVMRVYDMCREILRRIDPAFEQKFTEGRTQEEWVSELYRRAREETPELPTEEEFKEAGVIRHRNPDGHVKKLIRKRCG